MWCIEFVHDFSYGSREGHIVAVGTDINEVPDVLENIRKQYIINNKDLYGPDSKLLRLDDSIRDIFAIHDTDKFIVYDLPANGFISSILGGSLAPHSIWTIESDYDDEADDYALSDSDNGSGVGSDDESDDE